MDNFTIFSLSLFDHIILLTYPYQHLLEKKLLYEQDIILLANQKFIMFTVLIFIKSHVSVSSNYVTT